MTSNAASTTISTRSRPPQSFVSSYAPRVRQYSNGLIAPAVQPPNVIPPIRTTKRGTTAINYAEDGYGSDDFDETDGSAVPGLRGRSTGLRSGRRDELGAGPTNVVNVGLSQQQEKQLGKEIHQPVELQGIWREWMGRAKVNRTPRQAVTQTLLPTNLVPIRIDVDVQPFRPEPALPLPPQDSDAMRVLGLDSGLAAYRPGEMLNAPMRIKDQFLWNLHEALVTPDQFAKVLVEELDLPQERRITTIIDITRQMREQMEAYAAVALNPLWSPEGVREVAKQERADNERRRQNAGNTTTRPAPSEAPLSQRPSLAPSIRATPATGTTPQPHLQPTETSTPAPEPLKSTPTAERPPPTSETTHGPPDAYRTIISLSVHLSNKLYTDRIEWNLLHPPGHAEAFARITCADLGLTREWTSCIAHAIHEAVFKQKKEILDNGGLLPGAVPGALDNDSIDPVSEAGWRYDPEGLCGFGFDRGYAGRKRGVDEWTGSEWEPKIELLSKEEIEKREGDRERQLRRMRRETGRAGDNNTTTVSSLPAARVLPSAVAVAAAGSTSADYFAHGLDETTERLGRGERKKKRRFRSSSPDTPDLSDAPPPPFGGAGAGAGAGATDGIKQLGDAERKMWRCTHCAIWGLAVWGVKDGPRGPKTLCANCGIVMERDGRLPEVSRTIFGGEVGVGMLGNAGRREGGR